MTRVGMAVLVVALLTAAVAPFAASAQDATVEGTVTDADTGDPIQGADVTAWDGEQQVATATTDEDGHYSLNADSATRIEAGAAGYDDQSRSYDGENSTVDFELGSTPRYEFTLPAGDAYAVGVPGPMEADTVGDLFDPFQGVIYGYDSADGWQQVGHGDGLQSLEALVVVVDENAADLGVTMTFNGTAGVDEGTPPSRELEDGWNFVSPPQSDADAAFSEAEAILDQGYAEPQSQQVEGEDAFTNHTVGSGDLRVNPFKGYFVRADGGATVDAVAHDGITRTMVDGLLALGSGSLEGTVTNATGQPIANATVDVSGAGETTTDADGNYSFGSVPAGRNTVAVETEGYAPAERAVAVRVNELSTVDLITGEQPAIEGRVSDAELSEDDGIGNATVRVERESDDGSLEVVGSTETNATGHYGVHVPGNDTYNVSVEAADHVDPTNRSVLVGEADVTGMDFSLAPRNATMDGTVRDAKLSSDHGVPNATVTVEDTDGGLITGFSTTVETDENGSYAVEVPPHGEYDVSVAAADHEAGGPNTTQVGAGDGYRNGSRTVDFALTPLPTDVGGTVTDAKLESDDAIAGANVTVFRVNQSGPDELVGRTQTDDSGAYLLESVAPHETYRVNVSAVDHVAPEPVEATAGAGTAYRGGPVVENFSLAPLDGSISGTLTDSETGEPIANATVTAYKRNSSLDRNATTDENGSFTITDVPAHESYDVYGEHENYQFDPTAENHFATVSVGANGSVGGVALELDPKPATVFGTVTDAELEDDPDRDAGIEGVEVTVSTEGTLGTEVNSTTTDGNGDYALEVPADGTTYVVEFAATNHSDGTSASFTPGTGEEVVRNASLAPLAGVIEGTVVDNETGDPIDATVGIESEDGTQYVRNTGESIQEGDGEYLFEDLNASKEWTITVVADGYADGQAVRFLPANGNVVQDFALEPGGYVTGVVGDTSAPSGGIENATVTIIPDGGTFGDDEVVERTTTDVNGEYTTVAIETGDYEIEFDADGYTAVRRGLTVEPGENIEDAQLEPE